MSVGEKAAYTLCLDGIYFLCRSYRVWCQFDYCGGKAYVMKAVEGECYQYQIRARRVNDDARCVMYAMMVN